MEIHDSRRLRLTRREMEVLWLIALGHTDESIAAILGNKRTTISNHVSSILRKLSATSRASAVWQGVRLGILSERPASFSQPGYSARCPCGLTMLNPFSSVLTELMREHARATHGLDLTNNELSGFIRQASDETPGEMMAG